MSEKKKKLGKGLSSLLSSTRIREIDEDSVLVSRDDDSDAYIKKGKETIFDLPIEDIQKNPYQPRRIWDENKINELAESIKVNGLIQPIVVRPLDSGYQLVTGERRLKAMRIAGMTEISAIIRSASEEQVLEWALVENIHRTDLNAIERARAYQQYIKSFSLTQQQAAQRLGEDRSNIANYMRLLDLPMEIQQYLNDDKLSMGHARALLGITEKAKQRQLAEEAVQKNISVREIEREIKKIQLKEGKNTEKIKEKEPNIVDLEQKMTQSLGTKVIIKTSGRKGRRGKIIIEYYNLDDFDRIMERLNI